MARPPVVSVSGHVLHQERDGTAVAGPVTRRWHGLAWGERSACVFNPRVGCVVMKPRVRLLRFAVVEVVEATPQL